jgi:hypothetical protein
VYDIEEMVAGLDGKWGLEFRRSLAFRERWVAEAELMGENKVVESCG